MQEHEIVTVEEYEKTHDHKVTVTVDRMPHHVRPGTYVVAEFKKIVKVEAALQLDRILQGEFIPLADNDTIRIKGGEVFISHVRQGGSA
ncbi:MAG: hypothetical protein ACKVRP_03135 [Bacteroidota bacterium]